VEAVLGLNEIRDTSFGQAEGGLFEFRDRLPLDDPAEVATLVLRAGVLGVLLCEVLEVPAFLRQFQNVFGLLSNLFDLGICFSDSHQ
jgi:hypothetical protein